MYRGFHYQAAIRKIGHYPQGQQLAASWNARGPNRVRVEWAGVERVLKAIAVGIALANAKEDPSDSSFGLP